MTINLASSIGALILLVAANATAAPASVLSPRDNDFLAKAATAGIKEVELSRVASTRATDGNIRAFAETMVADHGKANDKLGRLAQDNGWNMPTQMDDDGQSALGKLQERKDDEFNDAYVKDMTADHDAAVKLFRDAAQGADNPILRDFARETLPTLEHHQAMVTNLKKG